MSDLNEQWLRCKVDRGMFSDEVAVTYPPVTPWQKSVFVPRSCVRSSKSDELDEVLVKVLTRNGRQFAVLPSSQQDVVRVEGADLHR